MTAAEARALTAANQAPPAPDIEHFLDRIHLKIREAAHRGESSLPDITAVFKGLRSPGPDDAEWKAIFAALLAAGYTMRHVHPEGTPVSSARTEVSWGEGK